MKNMEIKQKIAAANRKRFVLMFLDYLIEQKFVFKHGKIQLLPNGLIILSSYHPSPRNVNTKLISNKMMVGLFKKAKKLAKF